MSITSGSAKHGRNPMNVWNCSGMTSMSTSCLKWLRMQPTMKPVSMIADAILDCSNAEDFVLDPFGGSGSTLFAAETTGRRAALIELDPRYVDVIIRRFEERTGVKAVHAGTGLDVAALEQQQEESQNA